MWLAALPWDVRLLHGGQGTGCELLYWSAALKATRPTWVNVAHSHKVRPGRLIGVVLVSYSAVVAISCAIVIVHCSSGGFFHLCCSATRSCWWVFWMHSCSRRPRILAARNCSWMPRILDLADALLRAGDRLVEAQGLGGAQLLEDAQDFGGTQRHAPDRLEDAHDHGGAQLLADAQGHGGARLRFQGPLVDAPDLDSAQPLASARGHNGTPLRAGWSVDTLANCP